MCGSPGPKGIKKSRAPTVMYHRNEFMKSGNAPQAQSILAESETLESMSKFKFC